MELDIPCMGLVAYIWILEVFQFFLSFFFSLITGLVEG